ncbi:2549_t:CDS:2, partial [Rhizophagus irregularis]
DSITNSQPPTGNTEYSSSILSTVPERNAVIIPGANQITITYKMNDIKPSIGYITISQKNTIEGGDDFLRTKISANNSKSITIIGSEEIRHTFLRLMMTFVEVNGQNLTGSSWEVSTAPGSGSNEPGDTRATILLTPAGTKNYLENRNIYVYEMSKEISKALAIEEGRIFIPYDRYQYKRNTREDQILLLIDIKDTKTPDQPRTRTADLDPNYGAPEN